MSKKSFYFLFLFFLQYGVYAQLNENFNDGDFTQNPTWSGNTADFIVNPSFQLQSNNQIANSTFFLSTANNLATTCQWEFYVQLAFNPSSANYIDAYLTASAADLSLSTTYGYFVRLGNTDDEISLYRKDANGTTTKIIDGLNGVLNSSNNTLKIKVIRDAANQWILLRDISGTGNSYIGEGSVTDATFLTSLYFGFLVKQSTASFFQKHYFDDIEIKPYVPDTTPPSIVSATASSSSQVDLLFSEPVESASAQNITNYTAGPLGMPSSAIKDAGNSALVHLTFSSNFTNGVSYTLNVNNIKDLSGNVLSNGTATFSFYTAQRYDVVIDEIFPDPNPPVALPLQKFLELKNVSSFPINLAGWKLFDGSSTATLPSYNLKPDSFVIVCATASVSYYQSYGKVLGVSSFPSLNITQGMVTLQSSSGQTIHAMQYDQSFYKNELKKDGGWTLEMIDTKNPCAGSENWKASTDARGGTPGIKNTADGILKDAISPKLLRAFVQNDSTISLVFDEPLDSSVATVAGNYSIDPSLAIKSVSVESPFFTKVNLVITPAIASGTIYKVTVKNIKDCAGNVVAEKNSAQFGNAQQADSMDLVINEILFNPFPSGVDYIELYNRSKKIIDLKNIFLANRNSSNSISSITQVSTASYPFFPGEYIAITTNIAAVKNQYVTLNPDALLQINTLPSWPDDKGTAIILNQQGNIVDEVAYSDKWHFPLLSNTEGVSLERVNFDGPSIQNNFHSAASSVGYGTPGYKNSQYQIAGEIKGEITISPDIFSPDNDGTDDVLTINYSFPTAGYVANIKIFDASGRIVRYLQKNALSAQQGYFRWDGLDDKSKQLPQGIYIIFTEIFNKEGKRRQFKNSVVLARRF
ncbi:MAG: lamin tail domain-containing protein [Bacteroidetes bacterium]|nr:lamin tail domain-containing protein [Bacteroidota bacterium]